MIVATRMETLTKDEETGEEKLYLNDLIRCKDSKHYWESAKMCTNTGMPLNDYCEPIDSCSKAEKEEKPKEDAEAFIDNLLETLVLRSKSLEFTDMWAISNIMLGYIDGKKAMIKDVIRIIKEYKEKK